MPIELQWDPEVDHLLYWTFQGKWTWDEFFDAYHRELEMVKPLNGQRWDCIGDFQDAPGLPSGAGAISHVITVLKQAKELDFGMLVVVTHSGFIRAMVGIATSIQTQFRDSFLVCETPDLARGLIRADRQKVVAGRG